MLGLKTWGIDIHELRIFDSLNAGNPVPRSLRLARRNAHLGTNQRIHQCRFTNIGTANDGDIATSKVGGGGEFNHAVFVSAAVCGVGGSAAAFSAACVAL